MNDKPKNTKDGTVLTLAFVVKPGSFLLTYSMLASRWLTDLQSKHAFEIASHASEGAALLIPKAQVDMKSPILHNSALSCRSMVFSCMTRQSKNAMTPVAECCARL